jgi:Carbohydrate binding module (family 6)
MRNIIPPVVHPLLFTPLLILTIVSCQKKSHDEKSTSPYRDSLHTQVIQTIPGRIQCEYFDLGGEGIAYHDSDSSNRGSGGLNKGTDYLSTFRKDESVDISFTKFYNSADNSMFNLVQPQEKQLYVGWTEPGEWIKYTVDVKSPGTYNVGIMYTANVDGQISLSSDDKDISGSLNVPSTFDAADTIKWRQWHHWNYIESLGEIKLQRGIQVVTLHTVSKGQMNYDYLDFKLKEKE